MAVRNKNGNGCVSLTSISLVVDEESSQRTMFVCITWRILSIRRMLVSTISISEQRSTCNVQYGLERTERVKFSRFKLTQNKTCLEPKFQLGLQLENSMHCSTSRPSLTIEEKHSHKRSFDLQTLRFAVRLSCLHPCDQ